MIVTSDDRIAAAIALLDSVITEPQPYVTFFMETLRQYPEPDELAVHESLQLTIDRYAGPVQ